MYVMLQMIDGIHLLQQQKLQSSMNKIPTANVFGTAKYYEKNERVRDL